MKKILKNTKTLILVLLILSPGFWWSIGRGNTFIEEWLKYPEYLRSNINSVYRSETIKNTNDMRWANIDSKGPIFFLSKLFYNKATILADQSFSFLTFYSPRIYFHSGDGGNFSPPLVEPIAIVFLPFYLVGILEAIRTKNKRIFLYYFIFGFISFSAGKKNLAYLLPVLIVSLYFICLGLLSFKNKKWFFPIISVLFSYSIFNILRLLWWIN